MIVGNTTRKKSASTIIPLLIYMPDFNLFTKKGYKFIGTSHQDSEISEEEVREKIQNLSGLRYVKIAMEYSEESKAHLQFYLETNSPTNASALKKQFDKTNKTFWHSPHIEYAISPEKAISYIGNKDFEHKDGKGKGGKVSWCIELGKARGRPGKQKGLWKAELLEIKKEIEEGASIDSLWQNHFCIMIQCGKGIRDFLRDIEASKQQKEYDEKQVLVKERLLMLEENNDTLCMKILELQELLKAKQAESIEVVF